MAPVASPTLDLARFASDLRLGDIPEATRERVLACVADAIACAAFGRDQPTSRVVTEWVRRTGGRRESSVWGTPVRVPAGNAALALGTMTHAFDLDDYHNSKTHPGAVIVPAALALAEARGATGMRAVEAIVAGYEVMIRVSLAAGPAATRMRGWHPTGVFGPLGAAAASAHVLGLDERATASALGLAGTQSGGVWAFTADGSQSKRFHPGRAGQSGILAAELSELGFAGPTRVLEATDGGLLAALSPDAVPELAVADLGTVFHGGEMAIKPYAACGSLHSAVDALLALKKESDLEVERVRSIVLRTSSVVVRQCGFPFEPLSVLQAQMSAQYVLAVSLLDGACQVGQFASHRLRDPVVLDLARPVEVRADPEVERDYPARFAGVVDVSLDDGRCLTRRVDDPKGSAASPLSEAELREKFRSLAEPVYGVSRAGRVYALATQLHELKSVRDLTALLAM